MSNGMAAGPVRAYPRLQAPFPARWRQQGDEHVALASGISLRGCLVRTLGAVPEPHTGVLVTIAFPDGPITLQGTTVWSEAGRGFGLEFTGLAPDPRVTLAMHLRAAGLAQPDP